MSDPSPFILVIDDQAQNLLILSTTLRGAGYQVAAANSGEKALKILSSRQPDLILCDVIMDDMNGYEVCQRVKANPEMADIPFIFLTAQTENEQLLKGFEAGAVDYVTKPFNPRELLVRAKTHIELKKARDTIVAHTRDLERLNQEKNHFMGIAAHDLKNPLATMLISTEMVAYKSESIEPSDLKAYMQIMHKDAKRMLMIVNNLLDVNQIESGKLETHTQNFDLLESCRNLVQQYQEQIRRKDLKLHFDAPKETQSLYSDPHILYQILDNLFSNAVKYSSPEHEIWLRLKKEPLNYIIEIEDQGPGFSEEDQKQIFQKFARLSAQPTAGESSTGLGLSIVKMLAETLAAQIDYETEPGKGTCFTLKIPIIEAPIESLQENTHLNRQDIEF